MNIKHKLFIENAKLLSRVGIMPLMYGSLGLEYITNEDLCSDDIDILIPEIYLYERWEWFKNYLENNGYKLIDEYEHTFEKNYVHYSFAKLEELESFANIYLSEIKNISVEGISFKILSLHQYLQVYTASSKDGYRIQVREKKDLEKIQFIKEKLKIYKS